MTKKQRELEIASIVNTMISQMRATVGANVLMSWGISRIAGCEFNHMPTLKMLVKGFIHDGWVLISLNEGMDLYEVRLYDKGMNEELTLKEGVYAEDLGALVDSLIERPLDMSDEEYGDLIMESFNHDDCMD